MFWVADNGSSHRGQASIDRMAAAWPNAVLVHLPVHASWLNQVEVVFFSVIQRKVIKPADVAGRDALAARLAAFEYRYNATARPFDWKFTRAGFRPQPPGRLDPCPSHPVHPGARGPRLRHPDFPSGHRPRATGPGDPN